MNNLEIRTAHVRDYAGVGLNRIGDVMRQEPTMLHPDMDTLRQSYDRGLAVALVNGRDNEAIGLARFIPLLDEPLSQKLGLEGFPQIWELGSVVVDPAYRGQGLSPRLNTALLQTVEESLHNNELLILGTTKTARMLGSLHAAESLGFNFHSGSPIEFPMIAPFTCVCVPDFGQGFQLSPNCPQRIQGDQLFALDDIKEGVYKTEKIPCTMFVSDRNLTQDMNDRLERRFAKGDIPPQVNLVKALVSQKYYE